MKFKTYYINLDKDQKRNEEMINELNKTNLNYERFSGIDGKIVDKKELVEKKLISPFCQTICTDKTIGCGISHILLYKHIKQYDKNDYAIILEDDIQVINPELNYTKEIKKIIKTYNKQNPNWEIIRLHSFGFGIGSNAAIILNLNYIEQFSNTTLHYHIDIQQYLENNIIDLNILFNTKDYLIDYSIPFYNIFFDNQKIGFYMNNHILKIFEKIIYVYHIILFFIIVFIFSCKNKFKKIVNSISKRRNKIPL